MKFLTSIKKLYQSLYSNSYLQTKLILMNLITVIIPVALIFIFTFATYIRSLNDQLVNSEIRSLSQVSARFDGYMNELRNICQSYSNDDAIINILHGQPYSIDATESLQNNTTINSRIRRDLTAYNELLGVYLFCENTNRYVISRGRQIKTIEGFMEKPWYLAGKSNPNVGMLFAENILDEYVKYETQVLTYAYGLTDAFTGDFLGLVVLPIDIAVIDSMLSDIQNELPSLVMITDYNSRIVYHTDKDLIGKLVISLNYLANQENYRVYRQGNMPPIAAFSVQTSDNSFKIVKLLSQDQFLTPITNAQIWVIILFILCIGALILFTTVLSAHITNPIHLLAEDLNQYKNPIPDKSEKATIKDEFLRLRHSFNNMVNRINDLIDNVYKTGLRQKESELEALQSKINPHFLYNTLEMISAMASDNDTDSVVEATKNLGKILRYSLRFDNETVTVREEIEHLKHYISIQQMRFNNRFNVVIDMPPDVLDSHIIKLIIQPILENSIYHGLEPKLGEGTVLISGERTEEGSLIITITDNGVGIHESDLVKIKESLKSGVNGFVKRNRQIPSQNSGFALLNVHARLQLKYGIESHLDINSTLGMGTRITLYIHCLHDTLDISEV